MSAEIIALPVISVERTHEVTARDTLIQYFDEEGLELNLEPQSAPLTRVDHLLLWLFIRGFRVEKMNEDDHAA